MKIEIYKTCKCGDVKFKTVYSHGGMMTAVKSIISEKCPVCKKQYNVKRTITG